MRSKALVIAE
uniref:Uncharacterized protein n=1 Tax=Anguilla anguilla TaxID=7936 RepID=A0A0E9TFC3_ANGAN